MLVGEHAVRRPVVGDNPLHDAPVAIDREIRGNFIGAGNRLEPKDERGDVPDPVPNIIGGGGDEAAGPFSTGGLVFVTQAAGDADGRETVPVPSKAPHAHPRDRRTTAIAHRPLTAVGPSARVGGASFPRGFV